jgi:hypothetical protein
MTEDRGATKLCEACRGSGTEDTGPRFAGDDDDSDVHFPVPPPRCSVCGGKGRVPLGHGLR